MPRVFRPSLLHSLNKFIFTKSRYDYVRKIDYSLSRNLSCKSLLHSAQSNLQASFSDVCSGNGNDTFLEPRAIFNRVINEAYFSLETPSLAQPTISTEQVLSGNPNAPISWVTKISMNWPEPFEVQGVSNRKTDSEKLAYIDACAKLKEHGCLDSQNNPVVLNEYFAFKNKILKNPKCDVANIFQAIWTTFGNQNLIPKYESVQIPGAVENTSVWKSTLNLSYPEQKSFHGISCRLKFAEGIAAAKALHWLFEKGIISEKKKPLLFSKEYIKQIYDSHKQPYPLYIPGNVCSEMKSLIEEHKNLKDAYKDYFQQLCSLDSADFTKLFDDENVKDPPDCHQDDVQVYNIMNEKPYEKLSESAAAQRNMELYNHQVSLKNSSDIELQRLRHLRKTLPIFKHREEILKLIDENRVVVISGDTGSGKSTQVPQYILERFIRQNRGSECNIVVTQPRRLSAIALSQFVASEQGEEVGANIGYQVRLNRVLPQGYGSILYCTTGILLRKLFYNEKLEGVSHVIIDEVHERNIQIDFLLILMKRLLEVDERVKVILMSATFNTFLFSQYFNKSPIIHVSGHLYPVKEYFIDDMPSHIRSNSPANCLQIDYELVSRVIAHIDESQPPGAILCFLPGWNEIKSVLSHLKELFGEEKCEKIKFCLLHSRLLSKEQTKVFEKPPPGVRKIILSTNIAETSITIEDVVYVVDSGFHKDTSFDDETGVTSLGMKWITKANVRQRRGRAGRVQPGVCYHLYTRKVFLNMDDYPVPEMLRTPLEKVVLDCKVHCPHTKAEEFLSLALQPPATAAVQFGVQELQVLGILDSNEQLTPLGMVVKYFTTHPRLSKAIVLSAFLRCLDPVLTISAFLTITQDPFLDTLERKKDIQTIRKKYDFDRLSDHLALYELYNEWDHIEDADAKKKFEEVNMLDSNSFQFMKQLKTLFLENLDEAKILPSLSSIDAYNTNSHHIPFISASLAGAFYPNVIKVMQGSINHGKLDKNAVVYSLLRNQKAFIQDESVASRKHELPTPWLVYYSGMQSEARRLIMTSAVTSVSALQLLFLAGQEMSLKKDDSNVNKSVLMLDNLTKLSFSASPAEAQLLLEWRQMIQELFQSYLLLSVKKYSCERRNLLEFFDSKTVPVLAEVLMTRQVPFTAGVIYELIDGKLHSSVT